MSFSHEKTEVTTSGDLGYRRGSYKITATNPQTKQVEHSVGTYLTVFKKQAGGTEGGGGFRSLAQLVRASSARTRK